MTTATLTRTAPAATATLTAPPLPAAPVAARPVTSCYALDRDIPRISDPAGLSGWRRDLMNEVELPHITMRRARNLLAGVRAGQSLAAVARRARLPESVVLDAVVGIGSRITQIDKTMRHADRCLSRRYAAAQGLAKVGTVLDEAGRLVIVMGDGWHATDGHGRDLGRSYGAIVLSDPDGDTLPVRRWLDTLDTTQPVSYAHHAHLRAVAAGTLLTLDGFTGNRAIKAAYVTAFDAVADKVVEASEAVLALCQLDVSASWVRPYLRRCYWMVRDTRSLSAAAEQVEAGVPGARDRLERLVAALREDIVRNPARYFPRTLADVSTQSWRAIVAELGFHSAELDDAQTSNALDGDGTGIADLAQQLAARHDAIRSAYAAHPANTSGDTLELS